MDDNEAEETKFFNKIYNELEKLRIEFNLGSFSICGTPLVRKAPMTIGLNWGGAIDSTSQKEYPTHTTITFSERFFNSYLQAKLSSFGLSYKERNFNYTNLCLFRSINIKGMKNNNYKISLPIFKRLVEFIDPPWILSFGLDNVHRLKEQDYFQAKQKLITTPKEICLYDNIPFIALPHPIYLNRLGHYREKIMDWAINQIKRRP